MLGVVSVMFKDSNFSIDSIKVKYRAKRWLSVFKELIIVSLIDKTLTIIVLTRNRLLIINNKHINIKHSIKHIAERH